MASTRTIDHFVAAPDVASMAELCRDSLDAGPEWVARLADQLATSGERLERSDGPRTVDVASTGGPGSLTTLLAPLICRSLGLGVVKVGVPGRPAGGVDSLGSLPGYRTLMGRVEAQRVIGRSAYLHVQAGEVFCPLDARLFRWRQANGFQAVAPLAAASLLSKKLAAGVEGVVLDVRVSRHGNFGRTRDEAVEASGLFISAAELLGITAVCVLTSGEVVPQPWIGRGEALFALSSVLLREDLDPHLAAHLEANVELVELALGEPHVATRTQLIDGAMAAHEQMLEAHGSSAEAFRRRCEEIGTAPRSPVRAVVDGFAYADMGAVRRVLVERQRSFASTSEDFSDPCGLQFLTMGRVVAKGDVVALVRDHRDADQLARQLAACIEYQEKAVEPSPVEVIRG